MPALHPPNEHSVTYVDRPVPRISLRDFDARMDTITAELVAAAENVGFFVLTDHAIPQAAIDAQFAAAERFFVLPDEVKAKTPFSTARNAGWEKNSQVRPSTGCADRKESYQVQFSDEHMAGRWVSEHDLPGFRAQSLAFMHACHGLSQKLMVCLARGLGFGAVDSHGPATNGARNGASHGNTNGSSSSGETITAGEDVFVRAHDITRPNIQSVLRALHYFALDPTVPTPPGYYRAGAHADWSFLTLLFQRPGQSGLEICPGREAVTDFGKGDAWTKIEPVAGDIVCNMYVPSLCVPLPFSIFPVSY